MILRASVEDTPETAGKFAKKLPAFRNILIEVGRNADNKMCIRDRVVEDALRDALSVFEKYYGEDAKDLDDAVSIAREGDCYILGKIISHTHSFLTSY